MLGLNDHSMLKRVYWHDMGSGFAQNTLGESSKHNSARVCSTYSYARVSEAKIQSAGEMWNVEGAKESRSNSRGFCQWVTGVPPELLNRG